LKLKKASNSALPNQSSSKPPGKKKVTLTTFTKKPLSITVSRSPSPCRDLPREREAISKSAEMECFNPFLVDKEESKSKHKLKSGSSNKNKKDKKNKDEKKKKTASSKHMKKLQRALDECGRKIQKLEEAPIDWDKDEDSNFLLAAKLKERYMKIHRKIADYKETTVDLNRRADKKFIFKDSKYPEIGKKIEKFVNLTKEFPDFADIKKEIEEVNLKNSLQLTEMKIHSEAERIFVVVGKKLKRRRFDDDATCMYSYLEDNDPGDPATQDKELDSKLDELGKIAKQKIDTVFEEFVERQVNKDKTGGNDSEDEVEGGDVSFKMLTKESEGTLGSEEEEIGSDDTDNEKDVDTMDDESSNLPENIKETKRSSALKFDDDSKSSAALYDDSSQSSAMHFSTGSDVDNLLESESEEDS